MLSLFLDLIDSPEERDRFVYLYNTYNSYLFNYINGMVKDHHSSEDILQEVFLKIAYIIERIDFKDEIRLKRFLTIIARNRAMTFLRQYNERFSHEEPMTEAFEETIGHEEFDAVLDRISMEELTVLMGELEIGEKDILLLYYVYEQSYSEIGEILSCSADAARKRIERAERKLAELVKKKKFFE